jgi:hypothetical protein
MEPTNPLVQTNATPSLVESTQTPDALTVTGKIILGYGDHSPVADLPLWIGEESQGQPIAQTNRDGEFMLKNLSIGQTIDVVDDHLTFQVYKTSSGTIDLGLLKYPLIHPPTYYWQTPEPLSDLATSFSQGRPVEFNICQTDTNWRRPTEAAQNETVWSKRPFSDQDKRFLQQWFQTPAVVYDTIDVFAQSFPGGPQLDELTSDWRYLLGLWTSKNFTLSAPECPYGSNELDDLLARKMVEVWLLNYQAKSVRQVEANFLIDVIPASGFEIIRFPGNEGPLAVYIINNGKEIIQLP